MRNIEELIKNVKKFENVKIQNNMKSKKNSVSYVIFHGKPRVLKWYVPGLKINMRREFEILKEGFLKINIPTVYEKDEENNVLIMNYIIGKNFCDILNDDYVTIKEKQKIIVLLAEWFINFHNLFKKNDSFRLHGDANLRNFIFSDKVWGVDFEDSRIGRTVEDIAGICASILTTNPMFTKEKKYLCKIFIDAYNNFAPGRIFSINDEVSYAIIERIQWRPEYEELFRKQSYKIKEDGFE